MKCPTNANGTVTKIGTSSVGTDLKPIKLVNGVPTAVSNDFVDTSSAQTITGEKDYRTSKLVSKETVQLYDDTPSSNRQFIPFNAQDSNSNWIAREEYWAYADGGVSLQTSLRKKISGTDRINTINQRILSDGRLYVTVPTRTYNAPNTSDVVTIGTLQSSTDVVHTSGNESITGVKTFSEKVIISNQKTLHFTESSNRAININVPSYTDRTANPTSKIDLDICRFQAGSSALALWNTIINTNGSRETKIGLHNGTALQWVVLKTNSLGGDVYATAPVRTYDASNTTDIVTIGSLQSSTDVVHTSGSETIAGEKTFTNNITVNSQFPRYIFKMSDVDIEHPVELQDRGNIRWLDKNGTEIGLLRFNTYADGSTQIQVKVRNADGTSKYISLAKGDP